MICSSCTLHRFSRVNMRRALPGSLVSLRGPWIRRLRGLLSDMKVVCSAAGPCGLHVKVSLSKMLNKLLASCIFPCVTGQWHPEYEWKGDSMTSCRVLWLIKANGRVLYNCTVIWLCTVNMKAQCDAGYQRSVNPCCCVNCAFCVNRLGPCLYWWLAPTWFQMRPKGERWKAARNLRGSSAISTHHNMDHVSRRHQRGAAQRVH